MACRCAPETCAASWNTSCEQAITAVTAAHAAPGNAVRSAAALERPEFARPVDGVRILEVRRRHFRRNRLLIDLLIKGLKMIDSLLCFQERYGELDGLLSRSA